MPAAAGVPASPTLHPRTRPEASEFAVKNRSTGDWFRHDGQNIEQPRPPPDRLMTKLAKEVHTKNKGEPDDWFMHKHYGTNAPISSEPAQRLRTQEAKGIHDKIAGVEEAWYKHDDNRHYYPEKPKPRVTGPTAENIKDKYDNKAQNTSDWYQHEHEKGKEYKPEIKHRMPTQHANDNANKMRPGGKPNWVDHKERPEELALMVDSRPVSRVQTADAEDYLERNRHGSAVDWYTHHQDVGGYGVTSPRVRSEEGLQNAERWRQSRNDWFSHDANQDYTDPVAQPRCPTAAAMATRQRNQGQIGRYLDQENNQHYQSPRPEMRVQNETAQEIAKKNIQGMMSKYLDQDANRGYESQRPAGRTVKPEAEATFEKNKGVMSNMMEGYLVPAPKRDVRRIKPEAESAARRNKGVMNRVMGEYGQSPASVRSNTRIKPEAEANAMRNAGTMSSIMTDLSLTGSKVTPRAMTPEARKNAARYNGTANKVLYPKSSVLY